MEKRFEIIFTVHSTLLKDMKGFENYLKHDHNDSGMEVTQVNLEKLILKTSNWKEYFKGEPEVGFNIPLKIGERLYDGIFKCHVEYGREDVQMNNLQLKAVLIKV